MNGGFGHVSRWMHAMLIRSITYLGFSLVILAYRGDATGDAPSQMVDVDNAVGMPATEITADSESDPPGSVGFRGVITNIRQISGEDDCVRTGKDCDTLIVIQVTEIRDGAPDFEIGQSVSFGVPASPSWRYFADREIGFVLISTCKGSFRWLIACGC